MKDPDPVIRKEKGAKIGREVRGGGGGERGGGGAKGGGGGGWGGGW